MTFPLVKDGHVASPRFKDMRMETMKHLLLDYENSFILKLLH